MGKKEEKTLIDEKSILRFGKFELQTKSFWLSLVGILTLFLSIYFFINSLFWYKINKDIVQMNKELINVIKTYLSNETK